LRAYIAEISSQAFFADLRQPKENKPRLLTERRHRINPPRGTAPSLKLKIVIITALNLTLTSESTFVSTARDGIDFLSTAQEAFK